MENSDYGFDVRAILRFMRRSKHMQTEDYVENERSLSEDRNISPKKHQGLNPPRESERIPETI